MILIGKALMLVVFCVCLFISGFLPPMFAAVVIDIDFYDWHE